MKTVVEDFYRKRALSLSDLVRPALQLYGPIDTISTGNFKPAATAAHTDDPPSVEGLREQTDRARQSYCLDTSTYRYPKPIETLLGIILHTCCISYLLRYRLYRSALHTTSPFTKSEGRCSRTGNRHSVRASITSRASFCATTESCRQTFE